MDPRGRRFPAGPALDEIVQPDVIDFMAGIGSEDHVGRWGIGLQRGWRWCVVWAVSAEASGKARAEPGGMAGAAGFAKPRGSVAAHYRAETPGGDSPDLESLRYLWVGASAASTALFGELRS